VRMLLPPIAQRREIDRKLTTYFQHCRPSTFQRAISDFCRFYAVRRPRIEWYEYIDRGRTAGRTFEDGRIHLVHPENWKRCRVYKSERMWVQTVYHELAHYVFWTDAERKAETFTLRMVRGLKRTPRPRVAILLRRASITRSGRRQSLRGMRRRHAAGRRGLASRGSARGGKRTDRSARPNGATHMNPRRRGGRIRIRQAAPRRYREGQQARPRLI
jgi:hypothetical protein